MQIILNLHELVRRKGNQKNLFENFDVRLDFCSNVHRVHGLHRNPDSQALDNTQSVVKKISSEISQY